MRVLIVEDEVDLADSLAEGLRAESYDVDVVHDGASALAYADAFAVDLIILDRDLPLLSGDAVCRALRALGSSARIVMVTAATEPRQTVAGLDLGADDYIAKPFDYAELLARLRAVGRRSTTFEHECEWDDLRMDVVRRHVERAGMRISLAPKEFGCLHVLMSAEGGVVSFSN
jgi:DNA-binding response OmpR family regulator